MMNRLILENSGSNFNIFFANFDFLPNRPKFVGTNQLCKNLWLFIFALLLVFLFRRVVTWFGRNWKIWERKWYWGFLVATVSIFRDFLWCMTAFLGAFCYLSLLGLSGWNRLANQQFNFGSAISGYRAVLQPGDYAMGPCCDRLVGYAMVSCCEPLGNAMVLRYWGSVWWTNNSCFGSGISGWGTALSPIDTTGQQYKLVL